MADPTTPILQLVLSIAPRVNLALQQNHVPFFQRLEVTHVASQVPTENVDLRDVRLTATAWPPFFAPWEQRLDSLLAGQTHVVAPVGVTLLADFLALQAEREVGYVEVQVLSGDTVLASQRQTVEVLAPTEWGGVRVLPELLAAFVRPNSAALVPLLATAAATLQRDSGDAALSGYQSRDVQRVVTMVRALYGAVQTAGVTYINPPASFEESGQKVRSHEQVLTGTMGTCLDLTVLLAALCEQAGLHPLLLIVRGHAFPGVWLTDFSLQEPTLDEPRPILKRVELGEALVFDSSAVAQGVAFEAARKTAEVYLRQDAEFVAAIDVRCARAHAILPLPLDRQAADRANPVGSAVGAGRTTSAARGGDQGSEVQERLRLAAATKEPLPASGNARIDRWKARLLDLSLRNRLLNYKPGPRCLTLPLVDAARLEDALASDAPLFLEPKLVFKALEGRLAAAGGELPQEAVRDVVLDLQQRGALHSDLAPAEHQRVVTELWRQSRAAFEESGAVILYAALGMLQWYESDSSQTPRQAPLLLVPVLLERSGSAWRLRRAEEETRVNVTLLQKLQADFGLQTAGMEILPEDDKGVDVAQILHRFRQLVVGQGRWLVRDEVAIGLFSFQKFLMWLDLQAKQAALMDNPVVRHLLSGSHEPFALAQELVPEAQLDLTLLPDQTLHVVDADPSQMAAIAAAESGSSYVLQGPPGTGKSQTITNLIAQLLYRGKTVLFVSEKRAALDVVHNRLSKVGLSAFCLELHSNAASKLEVMRQLREVFEVSREHDAGHWQRHSAELHEVRQQLNAYAALLDAPSPFGTATRGVLAFLFGHEDTPRVTLPPQAMAGLDAKKVAGHEQAVTTLVQALDSAGGLTGHPWRAVERIDWDPAWERQVGAALGQLQQSAEAAEAARQAAAQALGLAPTAALDLVVAAATAVLATPAPPAAVLEPAGLTARVKELAELTGRGTQLAARRQALQARWDNQLWILDLAPLRQRVARWGQAFFVLAFLLLWGVRSRLRPLAKAGLPAWPQVGSDLDDASWQQTEQAALAATALPQWLGPYWRGDQTDWTAVRQLSDWSASMAAVVQAVASASGSFAATARVRQLATDDAGLVAPGTQLAQVLAAVGPAALAQEAAVSEVVALLALDTALCLGPAATSLQWAHQAQVWQQALPRLRHWCGAATALQAADGRGLTPLVTGLEAGQWTTAQLAAVLARSLRETWWESRLNAEPLLRGFRGASHGQTIARFRTLDSEAQVLARQEVRARLAAMAPDANAPGEEMGLLRRQLLLQRRHMPIRQLFAKIPTTLRRLKPCVLMSPLSVAQYLDASLPGFDVVVFDEASQIPPWDAVGAIARGRQVIVVGDSKQLPPTSFFDRATSDDDDDAEPDEEAILDTESILDEMVAARVRELLLKWHYRSKHESLIAFSNWHYYDNRLHTFPSSADKVADLGVQTRKVVGFYDRGGSRTNRAEAEAMVAELFVLLALPDTQRPSIGIVTFSQVQQRLVQDLIDIRLQQDAAMQRFFSDAVPEPVFIKNLENVQGDERDVMLFGICYGKDQSGKMTMNFGPLNRQGGERRLNVAVTRARKRLLVFTTMEWGDIDEHRSRAVGVSHLKAFLRYAAHGPETLLATTTAPDRPEFASPFEAEVHRVLTDAGWTVHSQVGCSGYRIDLAVVHPDLPGTYVLGIECDGATYHSAKVARARDRLREAVLTSLGWRIVRVWSTDWWYDRAAATRDLLAAVQAAVAAARLPAPVAAAAPLPVASHVAASGIPMPVVDFAAQLARGPTPAWPAEARAYRPPAYLGPQPGDAVGFYQPQSLPALSQALTAVVDSYGPLLQTTAFRLIANAWGLDRMGSKIAAQLQTALARTPVAQRPVVHGDFLWPQRLAPQAWSGFAYVEAGADARPLTEVAPEELANTALWVIRRALVISEQELAAEVARINGARNVTEKAAATVLQALPLLATSGRAVLEAGRWRVG